MLVLRQVAGMTLPHGSHPGSPPRLPDLFWESVSPLIEPEQVDNDSFHFWETVRAPLRDSRGFHDGRLLGGNQGLPLWVGRAARRWPCGNLLSIYWSTPKIRAYRVIIPARPKTELHEKCTCERITHICPEFHVGDLEV